MDQQTSPRPGATPAQEGVDGAKTPQLSEKPAPKAAADAPSSMTTRTNDAGKKTDKANAKEADGKGKEDSS